MSVELMMTTETLLREIADKKLHQRDIALTYRLALASSCPTDWRRVNAEIIVRWSIAGLVRVKTMAHRVQR